MDVKKEVSMRVLTTAQDMTKDVPAVFQIVLASCFIGICAQIKIPLYFTPVPLTGQTFGVMLVGALLGSRKGCLAALCYLFQGIIGLPVWAGGKFGFHHFMGPTGGYLLGYPLQAFLIGWLIEREKSRTLIKSLTSILIPSLLQMGIGTLWLSYFVGFSHVLVMGFYPFVPGEIFKAFLISIYLKQRSSS